MSKESYGFEPDRKMFIGGCMVWVRVGGRGGVVSSCR